LTMDLVLLHLLPLLVAMQILQQVQLLVVKFMIKLLHLQPQVLQQLVLVLYAKLDLLDKQVQ